MRKFAGIVESQTPPDSPNVLWVDGDKNIKINSSNGWEPLVASSTETDSESLSVLQVGQKDDICKNNLDALSKMKFKTFTISNITYKTALVAIDDSDSYSPYIGTLCINTATNKGSISIYNGRVTQSKTAHIMVGVYSLEEDGTCGSTLRYDIATYYDNKLGTTGAIEYPDRNLYDTVDCVMMSRFYMYPLPLSYDKTGYRKFISLTKNGDLNIFEYDSNLGRISRAETISLKSKEATATEAGLVKQAPIALNLNPESASTSDIATAYNNLLQSLKSAGIMQS